MAWSVLTRFRRQGDFEIVSRYFESNVITGHSSKILKATSVLVVNNS